MRFIEGKNDMLNLERPAFWTALAGRFAAPGQLTPEVLAKIIYLRQSYHFGPWKIMVYLERYYDIHISKSGIWRILKKHEINVLPVNRRYKRHQERWKSYEKPVPGHRIQVDVKFLERIDLLPGSWSKRDARFLC